MLYNGNLIAGWSSLAARWAHNPKVVGSNPAPATKKISIVSKQSLRINLLTSEVINHIAAGEVVARPLSVIKELLENSIDAGSTHIKLYVKKGGLEEICVVDNGCGIDKDDLPFALLQHATSKINNVSDLENINSLGFRGEALASIAAVSQITVCSKTTSGSCGFAYDNQKLTITPVAQENGTTITVSQLFYNTPARKKFLRSANTEWQHIEDMFVSIALSNFAIAFDLYHDNKLCKKLPAAQSFAEKNQRLAVLCGKAMYANAKFITMEQNGLILSGWILPPTATQDCAKHQYFFVNDRYIRDRVINHALRQAYALYPQAIISYCLYLRLDPPLVDVNVHPTKLEVRFREQRIIYAFLEKTIRDALILTAAPELPIADNNCNFNNVEFLMPSTIKNRESFQFPEDISLTTAASTHRVTDMDLYKNVLNAEPLVTTEVIVKIHTVIGEALLIAEMQEKIILVNIKDAVKCLLYMQLQEEFKAGKLQSTTLASPIIYNFHKKHEMVLKFYQELAEIGFTIAEVGANLIAISSVPKILVDHTNYVMIIEELLVSYDRLSIIAKYSSYNMAINDSYLQDMCRNLLSCSTPSLVKTYRVISKNQILELVQ